MGAYDCDCINNLEYDRRERKAQLSKEGTTKGTPSDTISRQAAIDAANDWYEGLICGSINGLIKRLNALPSAQPEPKEGHWIPVTNGRGGHECDRCHEYAPSYQSGDEHLSKYCPNCGAKMTTSTK